MMKCRQCIGKGIDRIDNRPQFQLGESLVHFLEHGPRTGSNPLNVDLFRQQPKQFNGRCQTIEESNCKDISTRARGFQGSVEALSSYDIHDVVNTSLIRQFKNLFLPFWKTRVVDTVGRAEFLDASQLLVAARNDYCLCA